MFSDVPDSLKWYRCCLSLSLFLFLSTVCMHLFPLSPFRAYLDVSIVPLCIYVHLLSTGSTFDPIDISWTYPGRILGMSSLLTSLVGASPTIWQLGDVLNTLHPTLEQPLILGAKMPKSWRRGVYCVFNVFWGFAGASTWIRQMQKVRLIYRWWVLLNEPFLWANVKPYEPRGHTNSSVELVCVRHTMSFFKPCSRPSLVSTISALDPVRRTVSRPVKVHMHISGHIFLYIPLHRFASFKWFLPACLLSEGYWILCPAPFFSMGCYALQDPWWTFVWCSLRCRSKSCLVISHGSLVAWTSSFMCRWNGWFSTIIPAAR